MKFGWKKKDNQSFAYLLVSYQGRLHISKMLGVLRSFIQPSLVVKPLEDIYSRLCVSLLPICGYKYASSFFFRT